MIDGVYIKVVMPRRQRRMWGHALNPSTNLKHKGTFREKVSDNSNDYLSQQERSKP
jgi:hypothetical protein